MSYLTQSEIAGNGPMASRVAQAAAEQHAPYDPDRWTYENRRTWAAAPGWDVAWEYAQNAHPELDPGTDPGVITDSMILAQVQQMLTTEEASDG